MVKIGYQTRSILCLKFCGCFFRAESKKKRLQLANAYFENEHIKRYVSSNKPHFATKKIKQKRQNKTPGLRKTQELEQKKTTENCHFLFVDFLSFFSVIFFFGSGLK